MATVNTIRGAVEDLRRRIGDNIVADKYTDGQLLDMIGIAWERVVQDINVGMSTIPLYLTTTIAFAAGAKEFILPACVGHLVKLELKNTDLDTIAIIPSRGIHNWRGANFVIAPPFIRFDKNLTAELDVVLTYIPRGNPYMHEGTIAVAAFDTDADTIVLDETPNIGTWDARPNAYVGMMFRSISGTADPTGYAYFPWMERRIVAYAPATKEVTVSPSLDSALIPATGTVTYEILIMADTFLLHLCTIEAVRSLMAVEQRRHRRVDMREEYEFALNSARRVYQGVNKVKEPGADHKLDIIRPNRRRPMR